MAKRQRSDHCGDSKAKRPAQRQQHLYLVVDDWERGCSIRKLDVDAFDSDDGSHPRPKRFTDPPVARMETLHGLSWSFVAHGTKIVGMQPAKASPAIPAFDTDTSGFTICPWPSNRGGHGKPLLVSVGGKLLALVYPCFDVLGAQPPHDSDGPWSWTSIPEPPPFVTNKVRCYAVHPDGRTLFVSAERSRRSWAPKEMGTFSLDTKRLKWTHHGDWLLPFTGQAYYDTELDAWVGLCCHDDGAGYICSCDVPPVVAEFTSPPSWKLGEEKLFNQKSNLHLGATLVYMGSSKFCLVESMARKDEEHIRIERPDDYLPPRRMLWMTTFGLKYDKAGKLSTATQRARSCKKYTAAHDKRDPEWNPVAFWI